MVLTIRYDEETMRGGFITGLWMKFGTTYGYLLWDDFKILRTEKGVKTMECYYLEAWKHGRRIVRNDLEKLEIVDVLVKDNRGNILKKSPVIREACLYHKGKKVTVDRLPARFSSMNEDFTLVGLTKSYLMVFGEDCGEMERNIMESLEHNVENLGCTVFYKNENEIRMESGNGMMFSIKLETLRTMQEG